MSGKKIKKYVVVCDADGDTAIWGVHADLTFTVTALKEIDIAETETPVVDLRNY